MASNAAEEHWQGLLGGLAAFQLAPSCRPRPQLPRPYSLGLSPLGDAEIAEPQLPVGGSVVGKAPPDVLAFAAQERRP